jgi:hypothetical protein
MVCSAQYLRDLLSLAKALRRFVDLHGDDANHDLFVTAAALWKRAPTISPR